MQKANELSSFVTLPQSFWYPEPFPPNLADGFLCLEGRERPVATAGSLHRCLPKAGVAMRPFGLLPHKTRGLSVTLLLTVPFRLSIWEGAALSQSHSFGTEGWWDLSFNVRRQLQRPGQAWLRAGCRRLSPPTLSESSYTYLLR